MLLFVLELVLELELVFELVLLLVLVVVVVEEAVLPSSEQSATAAVAVAPLCPNMLE